VTEKTGQDVEGDRDQFQRHEQQREMIGGGRKHHAREGEEDQREILPFARFELVGELDRQGQHQDGSNQEELFEEQGKSVQQVHAAKGGGGWLSGHVETAKQDHGKAGGGSVSEPAFLFFGEPEIGEHDDDAQADHGDFKDGCGDIHRLLE